jgi:hypothetical protein
MVSFSESLIALSVSLRKFLMVKWSIFIIM